MFDRLPPLQTLRAFESAGRLLSMTLAAEELHLTHGAVSRQVKSLEEDLGVALFRRLTRRIELTEEGAEFLVVVTRQLAELTKEAERLRARKHGSRLTVSTGVSFAVKWLTPRLHRLMARFPEFDIHLDVTDLDVDLTGGRVDVAIRYGMGRYPNAVCERIMEEAMTPVCSPEYRSRLQGLGTVADLARGTLLHEVPMTENWQEWFAAAGYDGWRGGRLLSFSHGSMAIEAAIRGEGVALGRSALTMDDISAGRLVALFPEIRLKAERGYDLVYAAGAQASPKISAIRDWLADEISAFLAGAKSGG
ncbi:transcriptional regulator GcvA [Lacibacterium aquatile]|uniref:Transcriptional regulator GcvA n=1 Tax=Lacibacterium aquatile TaxID=1168082 RepID=A0ABW5DKY6_9PROT